MLNHLLTSDHGQKIAIIVNEFGEVGIDHELIVGAEDEIIEMNNGCICCTVRGDLVRIALQLLDRKFGMNGQAYDFDRIVIETTGLADPGPVIQTFLAEEAACSIFQNGCGRYACGCVSCASASESRTGGAGTGCFC